jgi:hypothetical protein
MNFVAIGLLALGIVLILNGLSAQGKIRPREVGILNLCAGSVAALAGVWVGAIQGQAALAAAVLLQALAAIWSGLNGVFKVEDQRAFGYFCLVTAILSVPAAAQAYVRQESTPWAATLVGFGFLWLLSYLTLAAGNTRVRGLQTATTFVLGIGAVTVSCLSLYNIGPFQALPRVGW